MQPHRQQPTRLHRPWDSPGKNTGVGCHFLLQCLKVKSESEVAQSYLTLHDPMDCSPPGSPIHGIFQARVLEWVALPSPARYSLFPMGSPDMRHVSHIRSEFPPVALHFESSQFLMSTNWDSSLFHINAVADCHISGNFFCFRK